MKSMTGYGRGEAQGAENCLVVEIRSVNHRYLEISMRLPRQLNMLEETLKKQIQSVLSRGKVDVFLTLSRPGGKKVELILDKELAIAYHDSLIRLAEISGLPLNVEANDFAAFPGVLTQEAAEDDVEEISALAASALEQALAQLLEMREREGRLLWDDICARLSQVRSAVAEMQSLAPQLLAEQQQKLKRRVAELLADVAVDEARLANEVAFLVDKTDISEELTRLGSHCEQCEVASGMTDTVGRKLDFLLQEMNREINTIGSKSNALVMSNQVIEVKSVLEKIREQVQNIE